MENMQQRHDITDDVWGLLKPLLPGQEGQWGGIAKDNRKFINGVFWILRTGAPWRDLPICYGKWGSVHQRFRRWRGIATRFAKNTASFLASVQIRCIALWCEKLIKSRVDTT